MSICGMDKSFSTLRKKMSKEKRDCQKVSRDVFRTLFETALSNVITGLVRFLLSLKF